MARAPLAQPRHDRAQSGQQPRVVGGLRIATQCHHGQGGAQPQGSGPASVPEHSIGQQQSQGQPSRSDQEHHIAVLKQDVAAKGVGHGGHGRRQLVRAPTGGPACRPWRRRATRGSRCTVRNRSRRAAARQRAVFPDRKRWWCCRPARGSRGFPGDSRVGRGRHPTRLRSIGRADSNSVRRPGTRTIGTSRARGPAATAKGPTRLRRQSGESHQLHEAPSDRAEKSQPRGEKYQTKE